MKRVLFIIIAAVSAMRVVAEDMAAADAVATEVGTQGLRSGGR